MIVFIVILLCLFPSGLYGELRVDGFLFERNGEREVFITNGSTCNNLDVWPEIIDTMSVYGLNHFFIILNHKYGKWDAIIIQPLDFKLEVMWNEEFFGGLDTVIDYVLDKDVYVTIHLFSQCMLESLPGRWECNLWNMSNGGCVPDNGYNFFEVEEYCGYPENWKQWNYYYQTLFLDKCIGMVNENVIFSVIWEDEMMNILWFGWACEYIRDRCNNLVCSVPIQINSEVNNYVDFIELENRGCDSGYLRYGIPVVCIGPIANQAIDEEYFMKNCVRNWIHPSTNLRGECVLKSDGYTFAKKLRKWFDK